MCFDLFQEMRHRSLKKLASEPQETGI